MTSTLHTLGIPNSQAPLDPAMGFPSDSQGDPTALGFPEPLLVKLTHSQDAQEQV